MGAAASFTKDRLTADEARQLAGDDWNPELFDQLKGDDGCVSMDQLRVVHATKKDEGGLDAPLSGKKDASAMKSNAESEEVTLKDVDTTQLGNNAMRVGLQHVLLSLRHRWNDAYSTDPLPDHESGMSTALLLFEGRYVVLLCGGGEVARKCSCAPFA